MNLRKRKHIGPLTKDRYFYSRHQETSKRKREYLRSYAKRLYENRKTQGLCGQCGKHAIGESCQKDKAIYKRTGQFRRARQIEKKNRMREIENRLRMRKPRFFEGCSVLTRQELEQPIYVMVYKGKKEFDSLKQ